MKIIHKAVLGFVIAFGISVVAVGACYGYQNYQEHKAKKAYAKEKKEREALVASYQDKTYGEKSLEDISLSEMTEEEIVSLLSEKADLLQQRTVTLQINETSFPFTMKDLKEKITYHCSDGTEYALGEEEELARRMIQMDKELSVEEQYQIIQGEKEPQRFQVELKCKYNKKVLNQVMDTFNKRYVIPVTNAHIDEKGRISQTKEGQDLDLKTIRSGLKKYLNQESAEDYYAAYETTVVRPVWTKKDLRKVNTVISRFATTFVPTSERGHNIKVGASRINGTCLLPGESVSFDQVVHDDSDGQSFRKAGSYLRGQVVQTEGGGICQISTTAYNAILRTGILPEKRYPHSMPVHYVPLGLDAAISEGVKDLLVKNTLDVPILILAKVKGNQLVFSIKSYKGALKGYTYKPRAVILSSLSAKAYLDVYQKGRKQKSILLHTDRYQEGS